MYSLLDGLLLAMSLMACAQPRCSKMKIVASHEEIRTEIGRRILASKWANGYCRGCEAPLPERIQHDGIANWIAPVAVAMRGCEGFLFDMVASVRLDYDLPVQPWAEAVRDLLSARKSPF
jgi:hypothetical protein